MSKNALFLNLSCIFCFVKWSGKWKKCQKKCKKSCFFYNMYPKNWKSTDFVTGYICFYQGKTIGQKWKKTLKKTCFFHVFLLCVFAFCPDSKCPRFLGTGFNIRRNDVVEKKSEVLRLHSLIFLYGYQSGSNACGYCGCS